MIFCDMSIQEKQVGLTKDVGWQFGLRKAFACSQESLWDFMFSSKGLAIWLGELSDELEVKKLYKTLDGIEGLVRVFIPYSHIRMDWKRIDGDNFSRLQVRVMGNENTATISFHHEKLLDKGQREEMKLYWNGKMHVIGEALKKHKT